MPAHGDAEAGTGAAARLLGIQHLQRVTRRPTPT